jgi:hypothetical protein
MILRNHTLPPVRSIEDPAASAKGVQNKKPPKNNNKMWRLKIYFKTSQIV